MSIITVTARCERHLVLPSLLPILALTSLSFFQAAAATITTKALPDVEATLVVISGSIKAEDEDDFSTAIQGIQNGIVALDSLGGSLIAGLEIGKKIRLRNFATLVGNGGRCASVCALIWLGGTKRFLEPHAAVGFHAAYVIEKGNARESGVGNALVGAYLTNLGLLENAVMYITQASPDEITWLNETSAKELGIRMQILSDDPPDTLLAPAPASAPPPENSPLRKRAEGFIKYYWENVSDANEFALYYLQSAYSPVVLYYSKDTTRDKIMTAKKQFIERWPNRKDFPRRGTLHINCDDATAECDINGVADYEVVSETRNAHAAGTFRYWLRVRFAHGSAEILLENSEVIERR
jgi:hypothetical protein